VHLTRGLPVDYGMCSFRAILLFLLLMQAVKYVALSIFIQMLLSRNWFSYAVFMCKL